MKILFNTTIKKYLIYEYIKNKIIFLTGAQGHLVSFTKKILKLNPKKLIIFSRDESKQWDMRNEYNNISKLKLS